MYKHRAFRLAAVVAFGGFIFGLDAALISGTIRYLSHEFGLNDLQVGSVVSAPGLGVVVALLFAGSVSDSLGRKKTLLIIASLYLVSAVASTLAPSYETLVMARFLGGLAFTSLSLSSMYIGEIAPPSLRGSLVAMNQIAIVVGLSGAYFSNYLVVLWLDGGTGGSGVTLNSVAIWRIMLGVEIPFSLLWLVLLLGIPESPRWLIVKNRLGEARQVLSDLMPGDTIEREIASVQNSIALGAGDFKNCWSRCSDLLSPRVRSAMIIGVVFALVQPITGVNAVLFYAPIIFEQTGVGTNAAFAQSLIIGLVSLIFTLVALVWVDRLGRRPLVISGLLLSFLSLLLCVWAFKTAVYVLDEVAIENLVNRIPEVNAEAFQAMLHVPYLSDIDFKTALGQALGDAVAREYESVLIAQAISINTWLVLVGVLSFIGAFHLSIGPIMWVVFSEVVPTHIRGLAIPLFAFVTSIVSYFVQRFFPWQLNNWGAADIFLFYALAAAVGLALLYFVLPETRGKTIEEIELELAPKTV